jgi:hypothetical protein
VPCGARQFRDDPMIPCDLGRELAAGIPGAKFVEHGAVAGRPAVGGDDERPSQDARRKSSGRAAGNKNAVKRCN